MKKQNEKKLTIWTKLCLLAAVLLVETAIFQQTSLVVNAQGTATVTASSGKIRESASTDSEVLASVESGNKLDIIAQTTDDDGYTWYKVYVNGEDTGYIRADLVGEVTGSIKTESAADTSQEEESSADNSADASQEEEDEPVQQQVQFVQVNASTASSGKVVGAESVNVRENPSTSAAVAGKANEGTEVSISGEAVDNAGKIWYQVSFDNTTGFIRSDYVEVVQAVEVAEEATTEAVVEEVVEEPVEEVVNKEYEVVYEANAEGIEEWFLYDHNRGTKQSLEDLLAVVRQTQDDEQSAASQLKTFKILAVVMVAFILALIIVVTIMVFKLRDAYEYEYEDDDEDVDDEEDDEDEDDEEEDDDDEEMVVRRPVFRKSSNTPAERPAARARQEEETIKVSQPAKETEAAEKDTSWQSKNFLDIDDDMEFEFLDLK